MNDEQTKPTTPTTLGPYPRSAEHSQASITVTFDGDVTAHCNGFYTQNGLSLGYLKKGSIIKVWEGDSIEWSADGRIGASSTCGGVTVLRFNRLLHTRVRCDVQVARALIWSTMKASGIDDFDFKFNRRWYCADARYGGLRFYKKKGARGDRVGFESNLEAKILAYLVAP